MSDLRRPRIHFYHPGSWINDPNGLIYSQGLYHLFYQLNPDDIVWSNIHWGHAVSGDALSWTITSPSLSPDSHRGMPFSGTAHPVSTNREESILAMYTRSLRRGDTVREEQYIARFNSETNKLEDIQPDPVIPNPGLVDFRDPKIFRRGQRWHSVVACGDHLRFFSSEDFVRWAETSRFAIDIGRPEGVWECPDLLEISAPDGRSLDILLFSSAIHHTTTSGNVFYLVGRFDGVRFHPEANSVAKVLDYGNDFYAAQSWGGRTTDEQLLSGWMGNWAYAHEIRGDGFNGCLSLPRRLSLAEVGGELIVTQNPLDSISSLHGQFTQPDLIGAAEARWRVKENTAFLLKGTWNTEERDELTILIADQGGNQLKCVFSLQGTSLRTELDRSQVWSKSLKPSPVTAFDIERMSGESKINVQLYVDTCAIELFVADGRAAATELVPWESGERLVTLSYPSMSKGGGDWQVIPLDPLVIDV